jgi:DNA invertase Pin-like site-specific DNA recombinase
VKLGYARVSTADQSLDLQLDALKAAGCASAHIYMDTISGSTAARPGLEQLRSHLRSGDTLVVWRMDRLFRSLKHMIELTDWLKDRGIEFQSLTEQLDTSTPAGRLIFTVFASIGEFERELVRERTMAGLSAARARGRVGGRPKRLTSKDIATAQALYDGGTTSVREICRLFKISKTTFYQYVRPQIAL